MDGIPSARIANESRNSLAAALIAKFGTITASATHGHGQRGLLLLYGVTRTKMVLLSSDFVKKEVVFCLLSSFLPSFQKTAALGHSYK